jgi:hypothetical protein
MTPLAVAAVTAHADKVDAWCLGLVEEGEDMGLRLY